MSIGVWICVHVFNWIPLINIFVFSPISWGFYYYGFVVQHEIRDGDMKVLSSYLTVSVILGFLFFHRKLCIVIRTGMSTNRWAWDIFLASNVFFNFLIQRLEFLDIHMFPLLSYSFAKNFFYFYLWLLWILLFPWFQFQPNIICIKDSY